MYTSHFWIYLSTKNINNTEREPLTKNIQVTTRYDEKSPVCSSSNLETISLNTTGETTPINEIPDDQIKTNKSGDDVSLVRLLWLLRLPISTVLLNYVCTLMAFPGFVSELESKKSYPWKRVVCYY
eukprot:UN27604